MAGRATGTRRSGRTGTGRQASLFLRLEEEFFVWNLPEKSVAAEEGEGVPCDVTPVSRARARPRAGRHAADSERSGGGGIPDQHVFPLIRSRRRRGG